MHRGVKPGMWPLGVWVWFKVSIVTKRRSVPLHSELSSVLAQLVPVGGWRALRMSSTTLGLQRETRVCVVVKSRTSARKLLIQSLSKWEREPGSSVQTSMRKNKIKRRGQSHTVNMQLHWLLEKSKEPPFPWWHLLTVLSLLKCVLWLVCCVLSG